MAEYLAPGVFVEEVDLKPPAIEGVSLSAAGFVGATRRGPTDGGPVLVTGYPEFLRTFGGPFDPTSPVNPVGDLPFAVEGFFANGGRRLYVRRVAPAGTTPAAFSMSGGILTRLRPGEAAVVGQTTFRPQSLRGLRDGLNVTFQTNVSGVAYSSSALTIAANGIDRDTGTVTLTAAIDIAPAGPNTPASFAPGATGVVTNANDIDAAGLIDTGARQVIGDLFAANGGAWGDGLVVTAQHGDGAQSTLAGFIFGAVDDNRIQVVSTAGFYPGAWVEIDRGPNAGKRYRQLDHVEGTVLVLLGGALVAGDVAPAPAGSITRFTVCEFTLTARFETQSETFTGLTLANVPGHFITEVLQRSSLIRMEEAALPLNAPLFGTNTNPLLFPAGDDGARITLAVSGVDAVPSANDIVGTDNGPGQRTGLFSFEDEPSLGMIAAPGWGDLVVKQAMIDQCERLKYRIVLLDPRLVGGVAPNIQQIRDQRNEVDSRYASVFYPRIMVPTALGGTGRAIAPSGHVAGLIARVDSVRGVNKSPANEIVRGILGLESTVNQREHEVLNPEAINVIRDFRGDRRGIRLYGARMATSLQDWRYTSVRRLFIFIEKSIEIGTAWAVWEPNNPTTWQRLIDSVNAFLTRLWLDGALLGLKKSDAFFIDCGLNTMTQDDVDNGRLIMTVGVAASKPAEFVIIRISQMASGAFIDES
ncbi:phage tail sheath C-terminal domain-containing protein [Oceaniovalibus sp. ACAM 378]|uniref:phage tail sheath C-terminal domain-containing protein n=1 Tax=Oceaniovalibus sp. ACAM 378 TaxID=2599923 RepID=UPI0011DC6501|nr:phage tail sheath C-terminal domain-containing protein [Oceaniovalibus sp. ACAM 378]TYB89920.1 hypothetical protein FQ320_07355 [Oceaniovalibus sp. ACAM 378]